LAALKIRTALFGTPETCHKAAFVTRLDYMTRSVPKPRNISSSGGTLRRRCWSGVLQTLESSLPESLLSRRTRGRDSDGLGISMEENGFTDSGSQSGDGRAKAPYGSARWGVNGSLPWTAGGCSTETEHPGDLAAPGVLKLPSRTLQPPPVLLHVKSRSYTHRRRHFDRVAPRVTVSASWCYEARLLFADVADIGREGFKVGAQWW